MASSNSTKRAAKMAQRGKGRKVRFQNGTTFPAIIALILISGTALIAYSRWSITQADLTPPQPGANWEVAYGLNLCGTWYQFTETAATEGSPAFPRFEKIGLTTQGNGIINWNVTDANADELAGKKSVLRKFFEVYGANIGNDTVTFSPDYLPKAVDGDEVADEEYSEADTKCNDKDAEMSVRVWNSPTIEKSQRYIADVGEIRITKPGMVIAVYFNDPDAEQLQPPSVETLKANEAARLAPATSVPTGSVPPGSAVDTSGVTVSTEPVTNGPAVTEPTASAPSDTASDSSTN